MAAAILAASSAVIGLSPRAAAPVRGFAFAAPFPGERPGLTGAGLGSAAGIGRIGAGAAPVAGAGGALGAYKNRNFGQRPLHMM